MVNVSHEEGVLEMEEREIINNVLNLEICKLKMQWYKE